MKRVIVKGPALKLNGKWCYDKDTAIVSEDVYEKNKKYLDVVEEISDKKERTITIMVKDETINLKELKQELELYVENYKKDAAEYSAENAEPSADKNTGDNTGDNTGEELEALKEKAKGLGIKNVHNMKKDTLIAKIKEIEDTEVEKENPENE
ncbi:MAG: hypothetical protein ACM67R_00655 [Clostridiales bacterium]